MKKIMIFLLPIAVLLVGGCAVWMSHSYYSTSRSVNEHIEEASAHFGTANGKFVGTAIGTYTGITQGWSAGAKDGKAAGLSAQDTKVEIKGKIAEIGLLEVMRVSTNDYTVHKFGDQYVELQKNQADIIYTIDLTQIDVHLDGTELKVLIPRPKADITMDPSKTEIVSKEEYNTFLKIFNSKSEDGIEAAVNSWNEKQKKVSETFSDPSNDTYINAEELAKSRVKELIQNIRVNDTDITPEVEFFDESGEES